VDWYNDFILLKQMGSLSLADVEHLHTNEPAKYYFFMGLQEGWAYREKKEYEKATASVKGKK